MTATGKQELWNWMEKPVGRSLFKDEFYFKFLCANHVSYENRKNMIKNQKVTMIKDILHLTHLKKQMTSAENKMMRLLIEGALLHLEADIKWLDMIAE